MNREKEETKKAADEEARESEGAKSFMSRIPPDLAKIGKRESLGGDMCGLVTHYRDGVKVDKKVEILFFFIF